MTSHVHSKVVCTAFSEGSGGKIVPPTTLLEGPAVFYGVLRGCGELIRECQWLGRDFYHIDHGYFCRGHYEGYYRITRNGFQAGGGMGSPERFENLKIGLRPWKRSGRYVVVCPPSKFWGDFEGIDPKKWTSSVTRELSLYTDRPVVVKEKDGTPLKEVLEDAWCLVTHNSNAAVDALVAGVPVVTTGDGAVSAVAWDWGDIETPVWPDREPWAWHLADHQFTLEEMRGRNLAI